MNLEEELCKTCQELQAARRALLEHRAQRERR
jgi:hypothetical protein